MIRIDKVPELNVQEKQLWNFGHILKEFVF